MAAPKAFYVTTPIYYVNDKPHIGHAYTTLACDVLARFMRLDGADVRFLTGTDEHGQKVAQSAAASGVDTQTYCDRVSQEFRDLADVMNISYDDFIRTTEPRHVAASQAIWQRIAEAGDIYLGKYAGWYAVRDEAFYGEDELIDGPDGKKFAPSGAPVEWVEEPSYFFRLSAWQDRLLAFYDANPSFVLPPGRRNEVVSFVRGGLRDLSVSRTSFTWGVPVPGDDKHVMYVWLDALTNYITALGYPETEGDFAHYWPALHVVGKDILRFHAVYWPAFLMSAGLAPPARVFAHGWWTNEGQKISKSLGNVIDPHALVDRYGLDQTRYFLMREVPFGNDGDFSHGAMVHRINGDLANDLGNLAQRSLSLIARNCDGRIPPAGSYGPEDLALLASAHDLLGRMRRHVEAQAIHLALAELFQLAADANRYIDAQAPWALKKTDAARMNAVLHVLAEVIRHLAILAQPVMPQAMGRLLDQLAVPDEARSFRYLGRDGGLKPGTVLPKPEGIFPRYVETAAERAAG